MEMRLRAPVTRGYFFLLGALRLVNASSPRNIDQKKISSGTQGRTFSDGQTKVLPACNFLSQYYFYNIFLQKSCRFSLQTLTKFEAAKTGSGVGSLRLTAVWTERVSVS